MSVHLRIRHAVFARRRGALRLAGVGLVAGLAAGCSAVTASPHLGPDPSDPSARVPPASYRSTIAGFAGQRPVEPRSWREQNESLAPAPKR